MTIFNCENLEDLITGSELQSLKAADLLTAPSSGAPKINPSMPGAWKAGFLLPINISRSKPKVQAFSEEGREELGGRRMSGSSGSTG